jgi:phenylalanyl-tRNA synthetase beta chain
MLYLRSWLEEYIDLSNVSNQNLADLISLNSGEVEEFKIIKDWFDEKVLVGKIENTRNHPNANRLKIFDVNIGLKGKVQIVSAAPNVEDGLLIPIAIINAKLPYLTIAERVMRGEKSEGMCLGKSELMLETKFSSGLWELNELLGEKSLGQSICKALPEYFKEDVVFDIKYLQDKIGAFGNHLGLALEIANILKNQNLLKRKASRLLNLDNFWQEFQTKALDIKKGSLEYSLKDNVEYSNLFSLFNLKIDVEEYFLPHQMQQRLFFTAKNMIGGLADISNYLLFDVGQPTHFFVNRDNLINKNWEIQKLTKATNFRGLGQLKNTILPIDTEVITAEGEIVWIPGVSGSQQTKVLADDTQIEIEIANFPKESVAQNSFRINYRSDSARIWNSGIKSSLILVWLVWFYEILEASGQPFNLNYNLLWFNPKTEISGNFNPNSNLLQYGKSILDSQKNNFIEVDLNYLKKRINAKNKPDFESLLSLLGDYKNGFLSPSPFYQNLENLDDILFELAKLNGLENLSEQKLIFESKLYKSSNFELINKLKLVFYNFGLSEVITRPLKNSHDLLSTVAEIDNISLKAISTQRQDEDNLKDSLLPDLLKLIALNIQQGQKEVKIFEQDKVYTFEQKLIEKNYIDAVITSQDPYLLTSLVTQIKNQTNTQISKIKDLQNNLGKGFEYILENDIIFTLLEISNKTKKYFEIPLTKKIFWLSCNLTNWNKELSNYSSIYKDQSDFPKLTRSLSLVVDKNVYWQDLKDILLSLELSDSSLAFFKPTERFLEKDFEILNIDLEFINYSRNLTHAEIDEWLDLAMLALLKKYPNIKLR